VAHWIAAHELVSTYVPATGASKWTAGQRPLADESDPKAWLDLVEDDEFPLSIFYTSLKAKMDAMPEVEAPSERRFTPTTPTPSTPIPSPKAPA
jgi:hypothetical protein